MAGESRSFSDDRLEATYRFAHTMIVVDDQASQVGSQYEEVPVGTTAKRPDRSAAKASINREEATKLDSRHWLNAKELIDKSMELGLICSVLKPAEKENLQARVALAARRADILCFDWEIYDDEGEVARGLIREIVCQDLQHGGRLRLIAIYTGEPNRQRILNSILGIFDESLRKQLGIKKQNDSEIISRIGLRIVYLAKGHGTQLRDDLSHLQVTESELPERLRQEFSKLSGGILANTALATIGSIRDAAHHVIGRFSSELDGPYLHHRARIEVPSEAEEYAVDVILSELKSAIDKDKVAKSFVGIHALQNRLQEFPGPSGKLTAIDRKNAKKGESRQGYKTYKISRSDLLVILEEGIDAAWEKVRINPESKKNHVKQIFGRFFSGGVKRSAELALQFASLTGLDETPFDSGFELQGYKRPSLKLGCVLTRGTSSFWLCLQANCDAVRLDAVTPFVFVPLLPELYPEKNNPDHVIPLTDQAGNTRYQGLSLPKNAYTQLASISFRPNQTSRVVKAVKRRSDKRFYFEDTKGNRYEWLATLKQRRALRSAQSLGASMTRLGFDEFEPLRKK